MSRPFVRGAALAALALASFACRAKETPAAPAPAAPVRIESAELGLAIAALPAGLTLEAEADGALRFSSVGASGSGRLTLTSEPAARSVNVVEEAKAARAELEAMPEATFSGGNELMTPAGAGYTVRGSWREGAGRVEERRIFALHPDGSGRLVTIVERYPAGDVAETGARFQRALLLLGELEAFPPKPAG